MQHPLNAEMLRRDFPPFDPMKYSTTYTVLAKSGKKPTQEQVEAIRTNLVEYCQSVDDEAQFEKDLAGIEKTWPEMKVRFENSIGLTQMMLDHGCKSRYFYSYLFFTGRKLFFVALEMKDGYAIPVSFEGFEKIPKEDWAYIVAHQEPSHVARRVTDGSVQSLLRRAPSIFEAGAALLPAYRHYGYPLGKNGQRIVACDADASVLEYLPGAFGCALDDIGIEYEIGDALEVMARQKYRKLFRIVRMTGMLSYYSKAEEKAEFISRAQYLLADENSVIICDLQTMGADPAKCSLVRSALINLWPMDPNDPHKLTPSPSPKAAAQEMSEICRDLGLNMVHRTDFCNGNPLCLSQAVASPKCEMFLIGKNVSENMFDDVSELGITT